jgi:CRISPR-associated protein Cas1
MLHIAKAKNQINLLKYYNLRRKNLSIKDMIDKIQNSLPKIKEAQNKNSLMGIEGIISSYYWSGFKLIIDTPAFKRTHQHSKDPINQALNYAYAILYNKIQSSLIKQGLNIYYSFLHAPNYTNPTLVYDLIEPFRQPIVDREILSIVTKKQYLNQKGVKLDEKSKKIVIEHIQERLGSFTKTKYGKTTYLNLISFEANAVKNAIISKKVHKFFVAKY